MALDPLAALFTRVAALERRQDETFLSGAVTRVVSVLPPTVEVQIDAAFEGVGGDAVRMLTDVAWGPSDIPAIGDRVLILAPDGRPSVHAIVFTTLETRI